MARTVTVSTSLRPLRIGFLIDPRDQTALDKAFEVSACLWGGIFNPIIPLFRRLPMSWTKEVGRPVSAAELRRGYLDAFEPDVVVVSREEDKAAAEGREVYTFDEMISTGDHEPPLVRVGSSTLASYRELHREVFRFTLRTPPEVLEPIAADPRFQRFLSAVLGSFEHGGNSVKTARGWYREAFESREERVGSENYVKVFGPAILWPLRVNSLRLTVSGRNTSMRGGVFLMDHRSPLDLVDYWNLRAIGWNLIPLPVEWKKLLLGEVARGRYFKEDRFIVMASRTIGQARVQETLSEIGWPADRPTLVIGQYPRLADAWGRSADRAVRPAVHFKEVETEATLGAENILTVPVVSPAGDEHMSFGAMPPSWVNVVSLRDYGSFGRTAVVIPPGIRNGRDVVDEDADLTSEGIVFKRGWVGSLRFKLPAALTVCKAWFAAHGMTAELSGPGRTMQYLLDSLEGASGMWTILHPDLIKILERMAAGLVDEEVGDATEDRDSRRSRRESRKPRRRKKYILFEELSASLAKIAPQHGRAPDLHMKALLRKGILRVGAIVACERCQHNNWYQVGDLAEQLRCERCLATMQFPSADPKRGVLWGYRPNGPLSVPDYADGGYVALAAIRFLAGQPDDEATYVPSITLTGAGTKPMELDFAMWVRERRARPSLPT